MILPIALYPASDFHFYFVIPGWRLWGERQRPILLRERLCCEKGARLCLHLSSFTEPSALQFLGLAINKNHRRACVLWGLSQEQRMFTAICLQLSSRICLGFSGTGVIQERRPFLSLKLSGPAPTRCQYSKRRGPWAGKSALLTLCLLPASSFFLLLLQTASRLRLCGSASLKFFITFHPLCGKRTLTSLIFSQEAVKAFTMQWG